MKHYARLVLWLNLAVLLTGCISLNVQDPQDAIVTAKATLAGVNNTIAALTNQGQIGSKTAEDLAGKAKEAKTYLESSQALLNQGKPQDAMDALKLANNLLLALQQRLEQEQRK